MASSVLWLALAAQAGPPFVTDDPEPVDLHHMEAYVFSTGRHVAGDTSGTLAGVELNYGALPGLQLHAIAPLAFDKGADLAVGYGDTELGAKFRFVDESAWRPQIGVFPLVELPTGNAARGLGDGAVDVFLPLWLQKSFGAWTTYGGAGAWIRTARGSLDSLFVGWLLQRQLGPKLVLGGELFEETADAPGGDDSTAFDLGGVFDFTPHLHVLFSAGRAIRHPTTTNELSYYLGFQATY